jgi:hypothetical protein
MRRWVAIKRQIIFKKYQNEDIKRIKIMLTWTVIVSVAELRYFPGQVEENIIVVEDGREASIDNLGRHGTIGQQQTRSEILVLACFCWNGGKVNEQK